MSYNTAEVTATHWEQLRELPLALVESHLQLSTVGAFHLFPRERAREFVGSTGCRSASLSKVEIAEKIKFRFLGLFKKRE